MTTNLDQNWKQSPAHIDLLSKFERGRDLSQILDWKYLSDSLGESTKKAIDRFVEQEALIPCTLGEALEIEFKAGELKKICRDHDLKVSGTKVELVERILEHLPDEADGFVSGRKLLKCSPDAIVFLEDYHSLMEQADTEAKKKVFEHLSAGNVKAAYRAFLKNRRMYHDPSASANDYEAEEIAGILQNHPDSLSGLAPQEMKNLQCAFALRRLWYSENPDNWIDQEQFSGGISIERAIAHMERGIDIRGHRYDEGLDNKYKVVFSPYDIDSCELCKALDGKEYQQSDLPNFPLKGCTSEAGCQCTLESVWDDEGYGIRISIDDDGLLGDEESEDPVDRMQKLKELLDLELISEQEYEAKRREILDGI